MKLKELLTMALILKIADLYGAFVVCTDAFKGLGGVLMQDGVVIRYESRKQKTHDVN